MIGCLRMTVILTTTRRGVMPMPRRPSPCVDRNHFKGARAFGRQGSASVYQMTPPILCPCWTTKTLFSVRLPRRGPNFALQLQVHFRADRLLHAELRIHPPAEVHQGGYGRRLEAPRAEHSHRSISGLSRERIMTGLLRHFADRPGAALDTLKKLRILIRHAISIGWIGHDPSLRIMRPKLQRIRILDRG